MRTYWHGDGNAVRVPLAPIALQPGSSRDQVVQAISAGLGFPVLLDWSNRLEEGDEVLVFAPPDQGAATSVPGRDDLQAESLVVWQRRGEVAGLFFAKTMADLVAILSMLASYEKALCEVTEYRERFLEIRARHARETEHLTHLSINTCYPAPEALSAAVARPAHTSPQRRLPRSGPR